MSPALVRREAALAAVALVAALLALAFTDHDSGVVRSDRPSSTTGATWYDAVVGSFGAGQYGRTTACGITLERGTLGIAHPVLPCGARVVVRYRGSQAAARVVDKGTPADGHDFDLTAALAKRLHITRSADVRWRFAQE